MPNSRRHLLKTATALAGAGTLSPALASGAAASVQEDAKAVAVPSHGAHLVLLGTAAGPVPMAGRRGISSALVVDGRVYLVDMGHGAFDQFQSAGLDIGALEAVFVTHLHSDHLADLYTLLWLRFGGVDPLARPLTMYGPGPAGALPAPSSGRSVATVNPRRPTPGLSDYIENSVAATAYDINLRMRDEGWPDIRSFVDVHEIAVPDVGASPTGDMAPAMAPFEVWSDDQVRVTAILVDHPPVFPSFAFRFDTEHGSVVFSGDTTITANMVTLARDADVLVHEAIDMEAVERAGNLTPEQLQHHENSHADVTRIGREVAQPAQVRTLVLSHLAPGTKALPDAGWKAKAGRGFTGRVVVGNDLQVLPLTGR
ncbi:MBL fold metallo-hydrolase (plasmid) [Streptomyces sp. NBC_00015]|uniref:MBL fold metallo-hydrolase n=1 Tax=Streptomyces sp. NBC_00015 TaxID=2903611 RepID=UPI002F91A1A6